MNNFYRIQQKRGHRRLLEMLRSTKLSICLSIDYSRFTYLFLIHSRDIIYSSSFKNCFSQLAAAFCPLTRAFCSPGRSGSPRTKQECTTPGKN